jgi:hypothetical protein
MRFKLHTLGLFLTSAAACLLCVMLVIVTAVRLLAIEPDLTLFLIVVPVFYSSLLGTERLYAKHVRICCPRCRHRLTMDYKPGFAVSYTCTCCGYTYNRRMAIRQSEW